MQLESKCLRQLLSLAVVIVTAFIFRPDVAAQSTNIATDGVATQSSSYMPDTDAFKAIDGNTNGTWGGNSLTHTNYDFQAWWQVDLGFTAQIDQIKLWNRTDCCPDRLSNYYVLVSNEPFTSTSLNATLNQTGVSGYYFAGAAGSPTTVTVARTGRYVRVQLVGTNYLTLAEVEVLGGLAPPVLSLGFNGEPNNVALAANKAAAVASSTHTNYVAAYAINGDRTGKPSNSPVQYWNDGTSSTSPDSLEITFNKKSLINKVNVFSVQDNYLNPTEPDKEMTFTKYGLVDFRVEVWVNEAWAAIPDNKGIATGNNKVWKQFTFPTIETSKIKIVVTKSMDQWVRIAEVEAILNHQGCANPGTQQEELLSTIQNNYTGDTGTLYWDGYREEAYASWRKCLQPGFAAWAVNGSQNLPVLGAAIGLFREPALNMTGVNLSRAGNPTYIKWWNDFLGYQVGALEVSNTSLGHFKGTEIFSSIYDGPVVSAIVAVRYWASISTNSSKPGAGDIGKYAKRYLRTNWFIYGLSAGAGPAKAHDIPGAAWDFDPYVPLVQETFGNPPKYAGHFLALAGSRSNKDYMTEGQRSALFDRAIQYSNKAGRDGTYDLSTSNEARSQKLLLNHLAGLWSSNATENLYGLTAADRTAFRNLINDGTVNYFNIADWLNGINTFRTFRILGWNVGGKQVRVSILESNPNGNTPAMYGVKYEQATNTATFLYPWTSHVTAGKCHLAGVATLYNDRVEASQPGVRKRPACTEIVFAGRSATMTIPQSGQLFHLVLSYSQAPYWETAAQISYPAFAPFFPWEEIPPGDDDSPLEK